MLNNFKFESAVHVTNALNRTNFQILLTPCCDLLTILRNYALTSDSRSIYGSYLSLSLSPLYIYVFRKVFIHQYFRLLFFIKREAKGKKVISFILLLFSFSGYSSKTGQNF